MLILNLHPTITSSHLKHFGDALTWVVTAPLLATATQNRRVNAYCYSCRSGRHPHRERQRRSERHPAGCIGGVALAHVSTNTIAVLVNAITGFSWLPAFTTI